MVRTTEEKKKVWIKEGEKYPYYRFSDNPSSYFAHFGEVELEMDKEKVEFIEEAKRKFKKAQDILRNKYKEIKDD